MNIRVHVGGKTEGYLELLLAMLAESSVGEPLPADREGGKTRA